MGDGVGDGLGAVMFNVSSGLGSPGIGNSSMPCRSIGSQVGGEGRGKSKIPFL